jgi:hypothetical protein
MDAVSCGRRLTTTSGDIAPGVFTLKVAPAFITSWIE